jgi:hypothetical protein
MRSQTLKKRARTASFFAALASMAVVVGFSGLGIKCSGRVGAGRKVLRAENGLRHTGARRIRRMAVAVACAGLYEAACVPAACGGVPRKSHDPASRPSDDAARLNAVVVRLSLSLDAADEGK